MSSLRLQAVLFGILSTCLTSTWGACTYSMGTVTCTGINNTEFEQSRNANAAFLTYTVSITKSQIATISAGMFDAGTNTWRLSLSTIDMTGCQTTAIAANAFAYYTNEYIPLPNLTHIDLSDNQIATISHTMFNLASLKTLNLQTNLIKTFSDGIILNALEVLNLSSNNITALVPTVFTQMSNIRYLNLDDNLDIDIQLGALQPLSKLVKLTLRNNNIEGQFGMFTGLENLAVLNITANRISMDLLTPLENLKVLDFDHNPQIDLHNILAAHFYLPQLKHISIDGAMDWRCTDLVQVVAQLRLKHIDVKNSPPASTLIPNVHGIACKA